MDDRLIIFDTTLRDGEQSPGASLTPDQKLVIAWQLARLGVSSVENEEFLILSGAADDGPAVCAASRLLSVRTKLCCRGMVRDLHRSAGRCFKGCECCKSRLHPLDINIGHFFQIYQGIARHLIDSNQLV